jgi:hypothetical protein
MPQQRITGLVPSNATDATNDITISAGWADDSTSVAVMRLTPAITKQLDVAWAAGTNQGGLDTGAVANTTYHTWLIGNPTSLAVDVLFSTSASAPTMPGGYKLKRRIFSFRRIGAVNQAVAAREQAGGGLKVLLKTPTFQFNKDWAGVDDAAQTSSAIAVPLGIQVEAILGVSFVDATPVAASALLITSLDQSDTAASSGVPGAFVGQFRITAAGVATQAAASGEVLARISTSATFRYRAEGSTADHFADFCLMGWIDDRVS